MRLLNTSTLTLKFFPGKEKPTYAILSHTWGDDEVPFQDVGSDGPAWAFEGPGRDRQKGVLRSAGQAKSNGYDWIWIDTCCIDKSSSAELSEAINSMFRWYEESDICYAYLSDVHGSDLGGSRWFRRGWTLQELVAPSDVELFDASWKFLGRRNAMASHIAEISGIDEFILRHGHHRHCACARQVRMPTFANQTSTPCDCEHNRHNTYSSRTIFPRSSIATRMSWAARRETTREEDIAYCLLGLFDVSMPLIYGEGQKAFSRLLKEIAQTSNDQSILSWHADYDFPDMRFYYPISPACFPFSFIHHNAGDMEAAASAFVTPLGLEVTMLLCPFNPAEGEHFGGRGDYELRRCFGILDCTISCDVLARPAIFLERVGDQQNLEYERIDVDRFYAVQAGEQGDQVVYTDRLRGRDLIGTSPSGSKQTVSILSSIDMHKANIDLTAAKRRTIL
ncbi:hypothetical protein PG997_008990, partial [Apiospora hydei]